MKVLQGVWISLLLLPASAGVSATAPEVYAERQSTTTELRQRADAAHGAECAHLSMQAARALLDDANREFEAGKVKNAHLLVDASVHYAQRATDCSLQARKSEKNIEIDLRKLIRRMKDVLQTLDSEDRPHLVKSLTELEKQRDRVLRAMFGAAAGTDATEKKP